MSPEELKLFVASKGISIIDVDFVKAINNDLKNHCLWYGFNGGETFYRKRIPKTIHINSMR